MKIVVVGPGAIGCLFAAAFARLKGREYDVWLFDKNPVRAQRLSKSGISVEGVGGEWHADIKATCNPADIGTADLVFLCVKSYDTKAAMERARALVGGNTSVVTLQNGIGNIELIGETAGIDNIVGGITSVGSTWLDTGKVRYAGKGETVIGKIDGKTTVQMRHIRELLNKAGFSARISSDIKGFLWSKLIINAGVNALTAVTRLHNGDIVKYEWSRSIMRQAVTEAVKVAKRKRIKLLYDDPLAKVESVCEATAGNVSSMLQDVIRRKRTEIDFINGVIVRFGQELSIAVPVNSVLLNLIKTIEDSYKLQV